MCAANLGDDAEHQSDVDERIRLLARLGLVLLPIVAMAIWVWWLGAERRAIHSLPPERRAEVYGETLKTFELTCVPPRNGLSSHCRTQATFLLNFDECDERCQDLVRPLLRWRSG